MSAITLSFGVQSTSKIFALCVPYIIVPSCLVRRNIFELK